MWGSDVQRYVFLIRPHDSGVAGVQHPVDESWIPNRFVEGDVWGHQGLTAEALEAVAKKMSGGGR